MRDARLLCVLCVSHVAHAVPLPPPLGVTSAQERPLLRHPEFRIAFTLPWIGSAFPVWAPYFFASCSRSSFIADWLIFHEGCCPRIHSAQRQLLEQSSGAG